MISQPVSRAGLYARTAFPPGIPEPCGSVEAQLRRLRREALVRKWAIIVAAGDARPPQKPQTFAGRNEVLRAVDAGEVDVLLVVRLDRIVGSADEVFALLGRLRKAGVKLVALEDGIDLPANDIILAFGDSMAAVAISIRGERYVVGRDNVRGTLPRGRRPGRPRRGVTAAGALAAYNRHGSIQAAARALSVSPSTVWSRLKEAQREAVAVGGREEEPA